jgi:hypothetical protein
MNVPNGMQDIVPPAQPEDENAGPDDLDQADPEQAEQEVLRAKVDAYIDAIFKGHLTKEIVSAGGALWAATFNLNPNPLRGNRPRVTEVAVNKAWIWEQFIAHQITTNQMGERMVATLLASTDEQKSYYLNRESTFDKQIQNL